MPISVADMIALFPNKEGQDQTNVALLAIAGAIDRKNHSAGRLSFKELWMLNRMGLAHTVVAPGETQIEVMKEKQLIIHALSSIVVHVDEDTFVTKVGEVSDKVFEFVYDSQNIGWTYEGVVINLPEYGISINGTPSDGDAFTIEEDIEIVTFDVAAIDQHRPANPALKHSISLLCTEAVAGFPYCPTQAAITVQSGTLPAATYAVGIPANYDASYNDHEEGSYALFTLAQAVPAGGQIMIPWGYQQHLKNAKVSTYTAFSTTAIESNISISMADTIAGSVVVLGDLANGEIHAETPALLTGVTVLLNNIERMRYGSNDVRTACMLQWLSSDAASGWHQQVSPFDRPQTTPTAGFLHGMDPEFLQIIGKVKLRSAFNTVCKSLAGESNTDTYYDGEYLAWLPSMTELGWGANNSVIETSPDADGNVENKPLALFDGATNADRIRRNSGTARSWWLRSPNPSYAYYERGVSTDGSLGNGYAFIGYWAVPGLDII